MNVYIFYKEIESYVTKFKFEDNDCLKDKSDEVWDYLLFDNDEISSAQPGNANILTQKKPIWSIDSMLT